jgi:hypothetical protein
MPDRQLDIDPQAPQKEAAMFYGLFLRGCPADAIRRDIEIPFDVVKRMLSHPCYEEGFRERVRRTYHFRRQVLAIFDELVTSEKARRRMQ